jgi:TolB-like protein/class 3 adenylate cyclase/lipopolysaccharide biosynthesis regulator YciM
MASQLPSTPPLAIGHVLVIDIVGYSKLLMHEEREAVQELARIVRGTEQFRNAEASGKLTRLPTGDGMILVFYDSPESPVKCATEIARAAAGQSQFRLRMGIHSGPVSEVMDVNDRMNLTGAGINIAQRVMECAEAGHILLSKRTADDLLPFSDWQPHLKQLGECGVKHGERIFVVNLVTDEIGNPELPARFVQPVIGSHEVTARGWRRNAIPAIAFLALLFAIGYIALNHFSGAHDSKEAAQPSLPVLSRPGVKSVAVLPFENLSDDKSNSYFADGMQEEIITDLARVADLKVISRTSVMAYKSGKRNLREIAAALGVTHVIEGSVQRAANQVRVHAQLIDARNDFHIWANQYDGDLADVFAIQSDIAEKIVSQLEAKLSSSEKEAIEHRRTSDVDAYDLYLRAKALNNTLSFTSRMRDSLFEVVGLLEQAVRRDPEFFDAYAELARAHDTIYLLGLDRSPKRIAMAEQAARVAVQLRPQSGNAHLALAHHLYSVLAYDKARAELKIAQQALPNEPRVYLIAGYIDRRQNRWAESTLDMERAVELDPLNVEILQQLSLTYENQRRFRKMAAVLDRALALAPDDVGIRIVRALVDLEWRADPKPLRETVDAILVEDPKAAPDIAQAWLYVAMCQRDWEAASRALQAMTEDGCRNEGVMFPHSFCEGATARARGDAAAALASFNRAEQELQKRIEAGRETGETLCALSLTNAALGKKEIAQAQGKRAVELLPLTEDAINGTLAREYLALTYLWAGEKDLALEQLARVCESPGWINYGDLRLHPFWDPLRGDPRFDKVVASLAPKEEKTSASP